MLDPNQTAQMQPYFPWLIIAAVVGLFLILRITRKGLRRRVDEIGDRRGGEGDRAIRRSSTSSTRTTGTGPATTGRSTWAARRAASTTRTRRPGSGWTRRSPW